MIAGHVPDEKDSRPPVLNRRLDDVRVLDLTRLLPGPHATQLLALTGAEVIKIEEPDGGDHARSPSPALFQQVNRGKAPLTLELRVAKDRDAFKVLIAAPDVVIESFRHRLMERLDGGHDTFKAINPRLVYATLAGYGPTGQVADGAGHDLDYLVLARALHQNGTIGDAPAISNVQSVDLASGAPTWAVGVLAAVIGARSSGQGRLRGCGHARRLAGMAAGRRGHAPRPRRHPAARGRQARRHAAQLPGL